MRKVMLTLLGLGLALTLVTTAEAGGRRCGYGGPVYVQQVQAPVAATARVDQGYRSFSYQPTAAPVAAPVMRYQAPVRRMGGGHAYENAINKSLGRVN